MPDDGPFIPNVERALGIFEGTLKAHADRMDRTDIAIGLMKTELKADFGARFDMVRTHLDLQDKKLDGNTVKLDLLVVASERAAGVKDDRQFKFNNNVNFWVMAAAIVTVLGVLGNMIGHSLWAILLPTLGVH